MRRFLSAGLAALLCFTVLLGLSACGGGSNSFTWRVDALPTNLDPQVASTSSDVMACLHLYSGLFRMGTDGQPQPECCESYTLSEDGCTYTFTLRQGLTYTEGKGKSTDTPVTAHDFAFGLRRVFLPETGSPYRQALSVIAGSDALYAQGDDSSFGVQALNDLTLRITLSEPDSGFLEKLCLPGAMPCNQAFFSGSSGAYGLSSSLVLSNGSFYLYNWTSSGVFLRRQANGAQVNAVRLVLAGENLDTGESAATPVEQILAGQSDGVLYDGQPGTGLTELPYTTETWCLLLQCSGSLNNSAIRQALTAVALSTALPLSDTYTAAEGLVPPDVSLGSGSYRSRVGSTLPNSTASAVQLYRTGLSELNTSTLRGITVLVPEGNEASALFDYINQSWQAELGLYCNVEQLPLQELQARVASGDYTIALAPIESTEDSPLSALTQCSGGSLTGWQSASYDSGLAQLSGTPLLDADAPALAALERQLLDSCSVVPLFYQTRLLLLSPTVSQVVFDPFRSVLDLTYATKQ